MPLSLVVNLNEDFLKCVWILSEGQSSKQEARLKFSLSARRPLCEMVCCKILVCSKRPWPIKCCSNLFEGPVVIKSWEKPLFLSPAGARRFAPSCDEAWLLIKAEDRPSEG